MTEFKSKGDRKDACHLFAFLSRSFSRSLSRFSPFAFLRFVILSGGERETPFSNDALPSRSRRTFPARRKGRDLGGISGHESRAIHAVYAGGVKVATFPLEFYEAQKLKNVVQFTTAA
jgi:hypothetical protein